MPRKKSDKFVSSQRTKKMNALNFLFDKTNSDLFINEITPFKGSYNSEKKSNSN